MWQPRAAAPSPPRVLDLALRIGTALLGGGASCREVEAAMRAVTSAYRLNGSVPNVTFSMISLSYQPSVDMAPLAADRSVLDRGSHYTRVDAVERLTARIVDGLPPHAAAEQLAAIEYAPGPYRQWVLSVATALVSAFAAVMVGGGWWVLLGALGGGLVGERAAAAVARTGAAPFYQLGAAAVAAAGIGVAASTVTDPSHAGAMITGALFAQFPGRSLVLAINDGLAGYFLTAGARLLEAFFLLTAIVCGVTATLYIGRLAGAGPTVQDTIFSRAPAAGWALVLTAGALTAAFAVIHEVPPRAIAAATTTGLACFTTYHLLVVAHLAPVAATAVAAILIGIFSGLGARVLGSSTLLLLVPALAPLLPGRSLYLGLLALSEGRFASGGPQLALAIALGLTLAVGTDMGLQIVGRPDSATGTLERPAEPVRTRTTTEKLAGHGLLQIRRGFQP
ncbi:threonine/serine ThrE exporter family protein [Nocardia sp. NPDC004711]